MDTANIDRDLDRMIEAELEDWKDRQHKAVFSYASETAGELCVDEKLVRHAWVTLAEAQYAAHRLGVKLQLA